MAVNYGLAPEFPDGSNPVKSQIRTAIQEALVTAVDTVSDITGSDHSGTRYITTGGFNSAGDGGEDTYYSTGNTGTASTTNYPFAYDSAGNEYKSLSVENGTANILQAGAVADGGGSGTDNLSAIQAAIDANLGSRLRIPSGVYDISDELVIPHSTGDATHIFGDNRTTTKLYLTGTSQAGIRLSASRCTVSQVSIQGGGGVGNSAIRIAPEDETQTTTRVDQDFNIVEAIDTSGTLDVGILLKPGPDVSGGDSSCFHNRIRDITFGGSTNIGVHLTDGVNAGSAPANRNWIENCVFQGAMNIGVFNEGADTTYIAMNSFEGVDFGTSPKATPTAIYIDNTAPTSGKSNNGVIMLANQFETNTRDIHNLNQRSMVIGGNHDRAKCFFAEEGGVDPLVVFGGFDFSNSTWKLPGYKYQTNSTESIPNSSPVFDNGVYLSEDSDESQLDHYKTIDFSTDIFLADFSRSDSEGQTYAKRVALGTLIGTRFFFEIRIRMSSLGSLNTGETAFLVGLPFKAKNTTDYEGTVYTANARNLNLSSAQDTITGTISANLSEIALKVSGSTAGPTGLLISELSSDGDLTLSGSYEIEPI